MTELPGSEPVLDDELLYRRIPLSATGTIQVALRP